MLEATFFHKSHRVPKPPVHKPSCSLKKKEHEIASGLNTIFRIDVSLLRPLTKKERANCTDVYICCFDDERPLWESIVLHCRSKALKLIRRTFLNAYKYMSHQRQP